MAWLFALTCSLPVPPPPDPELRDVFRLYLLLDDKDVSRGVDAQISRRAMTPPEFNASHVRGYPLVVYRVQGFDERAPAWRIGGTAHWTRVLDWCPCGGLWPELEYYVTLHQETLPGPRRQLIWGRVRWYWTPPVWPAPPSRAIVIRDFIAPRVWWPVP